MLKCAISIICMQNKLRASSIAAIRCFPTNAFIFSPQNSALWLCYRKRNAGLPVVNVQNNMLQELPNSLTKSQAQTVGQQNKYSSKLIHRLSSPLGHEALMGGTAKLHLQLFNKLNIFSSTNPIQAQEVQRLSYFHQYIPSRCSIYLAREKALNTMTIALA